MFFAYNNGITATASEVEINNNRIAKIHNLQIVNGGQTTSAIYAAVKNIKQKVDNISVQMKLSVVKDPEKQSDFVSKVSEYANTQNKINKSLDSQNLRDNMSEAELLSYCPSRTIHPPNCRN